MRCNESVAPGLHPLTPIISPGCLDVTKSHVDDYAAEGLRTLVFAMREVSEEDYER